MSVLWGWHVYSSINRWLVSQETFVFCTLLSFLFCFVFHFTYWLVFSNRTPRFGLRKRFDLKYAPSSDPALWQISGVAILLTNAIARCVRAQTPKDVNTSHTTDRGRRMGPPVRSLLYTGIFIKRKRCPWHIGSGHKSHSLTLLTDCGLMLLSEAEPVFGYVRNNCSSHC